MRVAPLTALLITVSVSACGNDGSGPGPSPTQLAFTIQPSSSMAGLTLGPAIEVAVHDASGSLVTGATDSITLALGPNPSGATLSGTNSVGAVGGVATFSDLLISQPGTGYTLTASATALGSATSAAFDVLPISRVATAVAPVGGHHQTATVGQAIATSPSVTVTDGLGDPVANVDVTFSVASGGGSANAADETTDAAGGATVGGNPGGRISRLPNAIRATCLPSARPRG
jgi:hypothetical protein